LLEKRPALRYGLAVDAPSPSPHTDAAPEAATCDVCGKTVDLDDEDGDQLSGSGLYIWLRGDKVVYEEPPLCASCGTAISMTALGRWEIEEEEG
jgi:hypothetical protein